MTDQEWRRYQELLYSHPEQYARIAEDTINAYPDDSAGYRDYATYSIHTESFDHALSDLTKALALDGNVATRFERATVLIHLGRYHEALAEFDRCGPSSGTIMHACRATCQTYLGNLDEALTECAKIRDDHCMPDIYGQFGGTKAQITETARRIARAGRQG